MTKEEFWKKRYELREHPELADKPGYDVAEMLAVSTPAEWFYLLIAQPQFAPQDKWWYELRVFSNLPWAKLLAEQPQFEEQCSWESVSRLELVKLACMAPAIFGRRFPKGHPWDLYAFLTPLEKQLLLTDLPQLEHQVDWDELDAEWSIGNWMMLLTFQPQFEKYFDWSRIENKPSPYWKQLLKRQPQFACHAPQSGAEKRD